MQGGLVLTSNRVHRGIGITKTARKYAEVMCEKKLNEYENLERVLITDKHVLIESIETEDETTLNKSRDGSVLTSNRVKVNTKTAREYVEFQYLKNKTFEFVEPDLIF